MKNYRLTKKETQETLFAGFYKDFKTCLEEAVKRRTPLFDIDLRNKNLSNANLDDGIFGHADFTGCNLTGANLSESYCRGANFSGASLFNTCFAYANLTECHFLDTSFGATDMTGSIIDRSQFSTLSAFSINLNKAKQMNECIFIANDGTITELSEPPIVINGMNKAPIIVTKTHILKGHSRIDKTPPLKFLKRFSSMQFQKQMRAM